VVDELLRAGKYAELRALADSGDRRARHALARLLQVAGRTDELLARARADDVSARRCVSLWAAEHGDLAVLREMADAARDTDDDWEPRRLLATALADRDAVDELKARAEAGDRWSSGALTRALARRGDVDELRVRAEAGDRGAGRALVNLPIGEDELRARVEAGDRYAAKKLVDLLTAEDRLEEATDVARTFATSWQGREQLAKLLARRGEVDELRERAEQRDYSAADRLFDLLGKRGDVDGLRALADRGVHKARGRLIRAMERAGLVDELLAYARRNESYGLLRLLSRDHRVADLRALTEAGDHRAPLILANTLKDLGREDELRALAEEGSGDAALAYVVLLTEQGRVAELTALADAGDMHAAYRLPKLLDEPALRARADTGDQHLRQFLAIRYGDQDRLDDLRTAVAAGWEPARQPFMRQLAKHGHSEELRRYAEARAPFARDEYYRWLAREDTATLATHADGGDGHAGRILAEILVAQNRISELYDRAAAGDAEAAREIARLMYPPDDEDDRPDY
jgi:hypothetical protein